VLVLAVESATDAAGVALADETGPLGSLVLARGRRHTETLAPAVETLCHRVGVTPAEFDLVAVDVGPGLFTGLRVGVGTVKALSFALDIPVVPATSLEILAAALAAAGAGAGPDPRLLVPVVDARRGEVFSSSFAVDPASGVPGELGPPAVLSPEALAAALSALDVPLLLAGDGALRYRPLFASLPGVTVAGAAYASPPVTALAELAVTRGRAGTVSDGATVMPLYMRQADARINWEQRIAPRAPAPAPAAEVPAAELP
jgi:tRNA threonylcarbamoyladenosine biosynthesis protein TsaB